MLSSPQITKNGSSLLLDVRNENGGQGKNSPYLFQKHHLMILFKFYIELKFSPWNITEHVLTFGAYVQSSITYHRYASGIKKHQEQDL